MSQRGWGRKAKQNQESAFIIVYSQICAAATTEVTYMNEKRNTHRAGSTNLAAINQQKLGSSGASSWNQTTFYAFPSGKTSKQEKQKGHPKIKTKEKTQMSNQCSASQQQYPSW